MLSDSDVSRRKEYSMNSDKIIDWINSKIDKDEKIDQWEMCQQIGAEIGTSSDMFILEQGGDDNGSTHFVVRICSKVIGSQPDIVNFSIPTHLLDKFIGRINMCCRCADWSPLVMGMDSASPDPVEGVPNSMVLVDHYTKIDHTNEIGAEYCYLNGSSGPCMLKWNFTEEKWEEFHFENEQHI